MADLTNILLVDDIPENLRALEALLAPTGARIWRATSAKDALGLLLEHDFAVALLDVQMPEMSGFELAETMRDLQKTRSIPIIFVTAAAMNPGFTFRGYETGAVDLLYKPLDHHIVLSKVQVFLEIHRQRALLAGQLESARWQERTERLLNSMASAALSSLDLDSALRSILRQAVPQLGDICLVDLVKEDGGAKRAATAGLEAQPAGSRELLLRLRSPLDADHSAERIIRSGKPSLVPLAESPELVRAAFAAAPGSVLYAPIQGRGSLLGVLTVISMDRVLTFQEISVAENVARYLAMVVLNSELYRRAHEAVSARDRFISVASHELKTPLTVLMLLNNLLARWIETLAPNTTGLEKSRQAVASIAASVRRCSHMIDDLLDVSRAGTGALTIRRQAFELGSTVREIAQRVGCVLEQAGCELQVNIEGPIQGAWDRAKLDQVLTNLLSNAARYAAKKPVLLTLTRGQGESGEEVAEISVQDSGPGIPKRHLHRIFECYERGEASGKGSGLGLGLFITRQIVELHGGTIQAGNRPQGGAVFVVKLPLGETAANPAHELFPWLPRPLASDANRRRSS